MNRWESDENKEKRRSMSLARRMDLLKSLQRLKEQDDRRKEEARRAKQALKTAAVQAMDEGLSEYAVAKTLGMNRGYLRTWRGKTDHSRDYTSRMVKIGQETIRGRQNAGTHQEKRESDQGDVLADGEPGNIGPYA